MAFLGMVNYGNLESMERPKAWRQGIYDQYPNATPLCNLIYRTGKEKTSDAEFFWYERMYPTRIMTVVTAPGSGNAGDTDTIVFGTGEAYNAHKGSLLLAESTMERLLVLADSTDGITLSVKRGIGITGAVADIAVSTKVKVYSNAIEQGANIGSSINFAPVKFGGSCQIFRNPADVSRTLNKTILRTGNKFKDAQKNALLLHELDKEGAGLFGIASQDLTASPGPRFTTDGLISRVTTNVYDGSAGLTLKAWNAFLTNVMAYGSEEKLFMVGADLYNAIEDMARMYTFQWEQMSKQDTFGMDLKVLRQRNGRLAIIEHRALNEDPMFRSWGFVVDPDAIYQRIVDDTQWLPNREGNGEDRVMGEYLAEVGFEIQQEYRHGIIKNCNKFLG
jgi:hypothetical protein